MATSIPRSLLGSALPSLASSAARAPGGGAEVVALVGPETLALALVLGPLALGALLGHAARRLRPDQRPARRYALIAAAIALPPLSVGLTSLLPHGTLWELLFGASLLSAGFLVTSLTRPTATDRARITALAISTLLAIGALDLVTWLSSRRGPTLPPPEQASLIPSYERLVEPCFGMYSPEEALRSRASPRSGAPVTVLHVGDSMVRGTGVGGPHKAFPAILAREEPGVEHVNAGFNGAGTDAELVVLSRWVPLVKPRLVIVYVFLGNDLFELDSTYPCCDMGPVLGPSAAPRFEAARWKFPFAARAEWSPAPYALRVAASYSPLAARLSLAIPALGARLGGDRSLVRLGWTEIGPERWARFASILRAMRDEAARQRTELAFVVLHSRHTLDRVLGRPVLSIDLWQGLDRALDARERTLAIARELGVETLDTWDFLLEIMKGRPDDDVFSHDSPGDVHFSVETHRLFAAWLAERLGPRWKDPSRAPAAAPRP